MRHVVTLYSLVVKGAGWFGALLLSVIALVTVTDVVLRNLTGRGIRWQIDFAEYVLFVSTFLMAPWIMMMGAHVRVDFLVRILPQAASRLLERLANFFGLVLCALLAWYAFAETMDSMQRGTRVLRSVIFPEWWVLAVMPFSFSLLFIEFFLRLIGYRSTYQSVSL